MKPLLPFLSIAILSAQEPANEPGRLLGKAVNAATNEPVRKASVQLHSQTNGDRTFAATTDNDGAFVFANIPPGDYLLTGEKSGFLRTRYGARTPSSRGSLVTVSPAKEQKDVLLKLIPAAVVAGRVLDEDGDPLEGAQVSILLKSESNGALRWESRSQGALTNDRGYFRISSIPPGPIRLSVQLNRRNGPSSNTPTNSIYPTTYFPGVDSLDQAQTLQLQPGQELAGLQLTLRRIPVYRIRGRYTGPLDPAASNRTQMLLRTTTNATDSTASTSTGGLNPKDGTFEMLDVRPGAYRLTILDYQPGGLKVAGYTDVTVGTGDLDGVVIDPQPPLVIGGKITLEQDAASQSSAPLNLNSFQIQFVPADLSMVIFAAPIPVAPNGAFQLAGVTPNRFRLNILGPPMRTYIKSMRAAGREVSDYTVDLSGGSVQLEIVLSTRLAHLKGVVERSSPDQMPGFVVLQKIGAPGGLLGQSFTYPVSQNGAFDTNAIAPGDYLLYAFEEADLNNLRDPEFLKRFTAQATPLKIAESETASVALKQIPYAAVEAAAQRSSAP